jgi:hypothetical protein
MLFSLRRENPDLADILPHQWVSRNKGNRPFIYNASDKASLRMKSERRALK